MTITIHYADFLSSDNQLVSQSSLIDEKYVYKKCPAFNHKQDRTFVGLSSIDFEFLVERSGEKNIILCDNPDLLFLDDEHINSPKPVIQIQFPKFFFWTHQNDIWFEFNDHPMTSYSNNFIAVPGWFNLSNWPRTMSLAITIVDEKKPVRIKKGDPLFRISFYSPNLDFQVVLKEEKDKKLIESMEKEFSKRQEYAYKHKSWRKKMFSKTGIDKCPFTFLYK